MASDPNARIERNPVEATQATKRPGLVYVLGAGLVLVLIVFAAIWLMQGHH